MKLLTIIICLIVTFGYAQQPVKIAKASPDHWTVFNRKVDFSGDVIHLNAQPSDGVLWLNDFEFNNGTIELDIKGKNAPGQSFVGVAFHGKDDSNYDAIYFRPFNFKNPERNSHSVQYISMPENDWSALRNAFPGKYENTIHPVPDPEGWFHVKIDVNFPEVKVYVDGAEKPSLEVKQISQFQKGKFGLWVGNNSEGWFKNVKVY